jgi:UDP:flavonoid glycosyltransferase YjiC (YdhE family)
MPGPRILFLVNGLGLGNSTRCHAVIQRLIRRGAAVQVITSGNGLWYFKSIPSLAGLHEVESLYYGVKVGRISISRTVAALPHFAAILRRNAQKIVSLINAWRPDVGVLDSMYTHRPFRSRGIPLVALNNADVVYQLYRLFSDRPGSIKAQFWCVEKPDYLFHRWVPDLVISPSLDPALRQVGGNIRRVGPIVRDGYSPRASSGLRRVLVMLSGSRFGSRVAFERADWPFEIDVVGQPGESATKDRAISFHGKLLNNRDLVDKADMVVVNGGFSAISESFFMRKPLVVVPVPNHAEQWLNARTIEHLGVGMLAQEMEIERSLEIAAEQYADFRAAYERLGEIADGAAQAADFILSMVGRTAGAKA